MCEECGKNVFKYKCPGCGVRSCGLECVKAHKTRTNCSGKRNRTAFVPISEFDDNVLISGEEDRWLVSVVPKLSILFPTNFGGMFRNILFFYLSIPIIFMRALLFGLQLRISQS
jgi:hypothetical protein